MIVSDDQIIASFLTLKKLTAINCHLCAHILTRIFFFYRIDRRRISREERLVASDIFNALSLYLIYES